MFQNLGAGELLIIVLVLVVLFGGNKITELAKGAGIAGRELKKAKKELSAAKEDLMKDLPPETEAKPKLKKKKKTSA
ncbi:twin-arginine translocase TatA/TatE family subunit [Candidatus Shapirobacteria bacterium]|nr:twin-arginine translocase TatA/TatE family subunit [Candidatus Shapirobacteria bacterium]